MGKIVGTTTEAASVMAWKKEAARRMRFFMFEARNVAQPRPQVNLDTILVL
jgi:hypothetical protein